MNESMRERLDPLIAERAPWLFEPGLARGIARRALMFALGYRRTVELGEEVRDLPANEIMDRVAGMIAREVSVAGLEHVPRNGPALIVCNHPTGIADGVILHHVLSPIRPDLYFFANHDILRVLPQMVAMIAPVEWRHEKRSREKTRRTMDYVRRAVTDERLGIIFPSGRLAKRVRLSLAERPWMASAAMIARKYELPVVPLHITARNSTLFYLFDAIHPTLRDITLFHETLNKARQPYRLRFGPAIDGASLPARSEDGIWLLRQATLSLAQSESHADVSLLASSGYPLRLIADRIARRAA